MKKSDFRLVTVFILAFLFLPIKCLAQNYIQSFKNGKIDWANAIVEAVGVGMPPAETLNLAQARALAKSSAIKEARRNLFEIIKNIPIDSKMMIGDLLEKNQTVGAEIQAFLRDSQVIDLCYMPDESVQVMISVKLTGFLADLVLPKNIRTINSVKQPQLPKQKKDQIYTGLVVDCKGFQVKPAMAPRILDENGREVYGSTLVSRVHAIGKGMAGYVRDLQAAKRNPRVATRPLTVKGISNAKNGQSDIIVSNADAAKIRGTASNLSFLQKCKVIIVLDQ